jgi:predicted permease
MKRRAFRLGVGRDHVAREVDDEIAFHLETKVQRLIAAGLSPDEARARALAEFGDRDTVRHDMITEDQQRERAMSRMNFLDEARQDLAYALRTMRRSPLFAAIVVLTLGVGIAANTSIFTLVNALLLRPLPVDAPQELVAFGDQRRTSSFSGGSPRADLFSYPLYRDLRDNNKIMPDIYASGRSPYFMLRTNGDEVDPKGEQGRFVSGNYFRVLRVPAILGRTFDGSEDDNIGGSPYVVISYNLWKRRFGSSGDVVGKRIFLSAARIPMTVIGVTPSWFTGDIVGRPTDVWIPVTMQEVMQPNEKVLSDRGSSWLLLMGRRPPGMSVEQVEAALTPVIRRSIIDHPVPGNPYDSTEKVFIASGARGFSNARASYATPLKTLMAGVILLLLIICANVANLLLARALARSKEIGVRMAIGAGRQRLVRQLLTESLVLGSLGGIVGLTGAVWGSRMLLRLAADGGDILPIDLGIDLRVLAFTAAIAILAVLLFGFVPAIRSSRVDLASAMRASAGAIVSGGMGARGQRMPLGRLLIGAQVALSLVLLVGASLLVRSLRELQASDPGLARDRLLVAELNGVPNGYTQDKLVQLAARVAPLVAAIPGVEAVSYSENGIFWGSESVTTIGTPGFAGKTGEDSSVYYDVVGAGYVKAIGGHLLRGRDLGPQDIRGATPVALINESLAKRFFTSRDPVGGSIRLDDSTTLTVVGLIADVKDHSLTEDPGARMYMAFAQHPAGWAGAARLIIRTSGDPARVVPQVRSVIQSVDGRFRNASTSAVSELMRQSISQERLLARLASGFGLLALGLAAIGLYGVMTYAVTRRTAEIGLRVALGAQRSDVVRMILRDAMTVVFVGIAVGVPAALGAGRLLQSQLHGVGASDPMAMSIALVVMASSAAIAALSPALRASRLAPLLSLRQE